MALSTRGQDVPWTEVNPPMPPAPAELDTSCGRPSPLTLLDIATRAGDNRGEVSKARPQVDEQPMATVSIPLLYKDVTGPDRRAEVDGATLSEIIAALDARYPGIEARICDGQKLSPTVTVTVDGKIASAGLSTPVRPESEICLLPSFGGG